MREKAAAVVYEVPRRQALNCGRSHGCDFKLEGGFSLKRRTRELMSLAGLLILVIKLKEIFADSNFADSNFCSKKNYGFEHRPTYPLEVSVAR